MAELKTNVELVKLDVVADVPVPVDISVFSVGQIKIFLTDDRVPAVYLTDYTVSMLGGSTTLRDGFRITPTASMLTKIAATELDNKVYIRRETTITTEFSETDSFLRPRIVDEFDRTIMRLQEMSADVENAVRTPITDDPIILPPSETRAGNVLEFDEDGKPFTSNSIQGLVADAAQVALDRAAVAADKTVTVAAATAAAGSASDADASVALAQTARTQAQTAAGQAQTAQTAAETAAANAGTAGAAAGTTAANAVVALKANKAGDTFTGPVEFQSGGLAVLASDASTGGRMVLKQPSGSTLPGDDIYVESSSDTFRVFATSGGVTKGVSFDLSKFDGIVDLTGVPTYFNVKRYGAKGDDIADDTAAIQAAINACKALGGGIVWFPRGYYKVTTTLDVTACHSVTIMGEGPDLSRINDTSVSSWTFYDSGTTYWRRFSNLGIFCVNGKNTGTYVFNLFDDKRGMFDRVQVKGHANGIWLQHFEETRFVDLSISKPSAAGAAVIAGSHQGSISGANLYMTNCFYRGFDDLTQSLGTLVGTIGLEIRDCNAIFAVNCDWSAFKNNDVIVTPTTVCSDHHFTQCFFDTTADSHCFLVDGAGLKQKFTFTGCWFAGAGNFGTSNSYGLALAAAGDYADWVFTGTRFYSNKGGAVYIGCQSNDFQFANNHFNGNTFGTGYTIIIAPPGVDVFGPSFVGNRFMQGNVGPDITLTANARGALIIGNYFQTAPSIPGGAGHIVDNNRTP